MPTARHTEQPKNPHAWDSFRLTSPGETSNKAHIVQISKVPRIGKGSSMNNVGVSIVRRPGILGPKTNYAHPQPLELSTPTRNTASPDVWVGVHYDGCSI